MQIPADYNSIQQCGSEYGQCPTSTERAQRRSSNHRPPAWAEPDHITTDVRDRLHWLPVQQRIEYKVCVLVYKCLRQAAPTYLAELCSPVSQSANRGHLRSAARGDLAVPRSRTTRCDQRCFAVSGPTLWNSLPLSVRDPSLTLTQFCARLKTVLFCRAYETLA